MAPALIAFGLAAAFIGAGTVALVRLRTRA